MNEVELSADPGGHMLDPHAPVPLGFIQALDRAALLRSRGSAWTWQAIADVMAEYHGVWRSVTWWRAQLRDRSTDRRPRGNAEANFANRKAAT